jgi:hypothetical protein
LRTTTDSNHIKPWEAARLGNVIGLKQADLGRRLHEGREVERSFFGAFAPPLRSGAASAQKATKLAKERELT